MENKSTLKEIEERFDKDVVRFSNIETGQATTLDAAYNMELIAAGISKVYPKLERVLDIGCGAGNYDIKLLQYCSSLDITLVDLSLSMLEKAKERIDEINIGGKSSILKGDFRTLELPEYHYDVIIATAVLHHLRDDADWETAFKKLYTLLKPGGSIWIFDLIHQANVDLQTLIYNEKYGQYLTDLQNEDYRDHVFAYIEKEDSPRSLMYQLDLLKRVGFTTVDILHKNLCFASFVAFR
ncbi:class I SAM-dependent methyltransferase [Sphingobacterium olei]|uniref:Class I SAM-dependent methyltransferase n=1 Tax=Sphingobacterium olei TaxID=2571155 RepID=A0A4U0P7Z5_9SPHI|nr:class I SAM-dependent methyltransferase [Sphingobacterium olei]TJZ63509.1 class I SAM-dependent methyltransferase [Sphingobacterium olei]